MLLKDCPVGAMVRLVSLGGVTVFDDSSGYQHWDGVFEVFNDGSGNYVIDGNGDERRDIYFLIDYQFALERGVVMELDGVTYNLTPVVKRRTITIDGVEYEMEEMN